MDLYMFDCDELNTFSKKEAEKIIEGGDYHLKGLKRVKVLSIEKIFSRFFEDKAPDYISFDTEGIELDVLKSIDFSKYRPDVISVRTLEYNGGDRKKNMQSVEYLKNQGYFVFADTWLKMIMVRKDIIKYLLEGDL